MSCGGATIIIMIHRTITITPSAMSLGGIASSKRSVDTFPSIQRVKGSLCSWRPHWLAPGRLPLVNYVRNRLRIAVLIYSMTNAVIFGAAIITVLNVPALNANAYLWIPVAVVASLILAAPIAWLIAPRLQARYDRWRTK